MRSPGMWLDISGQDVEVGLQIKYLSLAIDSQSTFAPHFRPVVLKASTVANALWDLLPNVGLVVVEV